MRLRVSLAGVALAGVALAGCASGPGPASIEPHLTWPIERAAAGDPRPTLGVGGFTDERPASARIGVRPPLEIDWFSVSREGVERAGDDAFEGPVPDALRADLIATLGRSGTFASVESVRFDPRAPAGWPASGGPDYVLVGTLEKFSGSQWRSFVVSPFQFGFVRDRFGPPTGRVSASFELWTRSGLAWQGNVSTVRRSEHIDLADAVLEALALNDEKLATRLDRSVAANARTPRRLELRVLDGCGLGPEAVRRLVAETSFVFERECEVELVALPEVWSPPGETDLDALLAAALLAEPPPGGAVLALAPAGQVRDFDLATERTGLAVPLGRHAVALCPEKGQASVLTAAHELGHLFGAEHVDDSASIMSPTADFDARLFDPKNRAILRANRTRDFSSPPP